MHEVSGPPQESSGNAEQGNDKEDSIRASSESRVPHESPEMLHPIHMQHQPMNGGMPPQPPYIAAPMYHHHMMQGQLGGLEGQFQSLGIHQDEGTDQLAGSSHTGEITNSDENEGDDSEEDPMKLFVGQIPKNLNEEDIFPTFDSFGPLKDVSIIRDKHSGLHRGCAFVTFLSAADAERAQEALHNKFTFPGARRATQVKPAEPTVPENKLFIGMLSRRATEVEVKELFAPYGEIREIYMIRNADGSSKCAAFLRYVNRESALHAIQNLNGNIVMEGAARPLIVKFADNKQQRQQRQIRSARRQEMIAAMGATHPAYGPPVPPHMAMPGPMYPIPPQYPGPAYNPAAQPPPPPYMYPPHSYAPTPPFPYQARPDVRPNHPRPREGPAGANLFVYHLPHDLTDADLATAFNPFGNVISAKVYVDKFTGESKGFGFVSYDSVISAESAIESMNGFQIGNKRLKVQHKRVHGTNPGLQSQRSTPSPPSSVDGAAM